MKVCRRHKKRDCVTCQTGVYVTPATDPMHNPVLYIDSSSYYSDSTSSSCDTSSSYSDSGGSYSSDC